MRISFHPVRWFKSLTDFAQQVLVLLVVVLLAVLGWSWFRSYTSPRAVFEGMLRNNLSTTGVIRQGTTDGEGQKMEQYLQLSFAGPAAARNVVTVTQTGENNEKSTVKTETIGTATADYSRYLAVTTTQKGASGKTPDFTDVVNVWGKSENRESLQYLTQAVLGVIPFANLPSENKAALVNGLASAYEVDYGKVKQQTVNGRKTWVYPVKVHTDKYVVTLKQISQALGLGDQPSLLATDFQNSPPIELSIAVDKLSRQLVQVTYTGTKQVENYSGYGLTTPIALPEKTVPFEQLQQRLQQAAQ